MISGHFDPFLTVLTQDRINLGWSAPDHFPAELVLNPKFNEIDDLIQEMPNKTCNIFSGIRAFEMVFQAFKLSLNTKTKRVLLSESSDWRGVKGITRLLIGRLDQKRWGTKIDAIYAIGSLGEKWFRMCGFPNKKIVPFAYFTKSAKSIEIIERDTDTFRLIFIGQCVRRKGIDILLQSLKLLKNIKWELYIIGDGKEKTQLENMTSYLAIDSRVKFLGARKNDEAMNQLINADILILPSRRDGWGAVVNEALMRGIPVICSNNCGAADLISHTTQGAVFQSGSVESLKNALRNQFSMGIPSLLRKKLIKEWASCIEADSGADYFLRSLNAVFNKENKVTPPWRRSF